MSGRVFVAGATGVLGRRVIPRLVEAGYAVTANVRSESARSDVQAGGADAATVDLFDPDSTAPLGDAYDVVVNLATSIPTGAAAARRSAWAMNDRLRSEASVNLAAAMAANRGRYVGESITFPYVDAGDSWIDEAHDRTYFWGNQSCADAEKAADSVTNGGGIGVALRFAMFFADDSPHIATMRSIARRGIFPLPGLPDARTSFVHIDDAADAVIAALDAPAGVYNVAEADPARCADHSASLAAACGKRRLRYLPRPLVKVGGASLESLARSQRVSSEALADATGWVARHAVSDAWRNPENS